MFGDVSVSLNHARNANIFFSTSTEQETKAQICSGKVFFNNHERRLGDFQVFWPLNKAVEGHRSELKRSCAIHFTNQRCNFVAEVASTFWPCRMRVAVCSA